MSVEEAAGLLRQVHDALLDFQDDLPRMAPVLVEVPRIIAVLEERAAVSEEDADALRSAWSGASLRS